jgi:hypothetical protein
MVIKNLIKSKGGWVKLMEVFIAILLLAGVLFVISDKTPSDKKAFQTQMSEKEIAILTDIELNDTIRTEILSVDSGSLPTEWNNFDSELPNVKGRILYLTPQNINCEAKICLINDVCTLVDNSGKEIYAESVLISADSNTYSPRELKLFCMQK